MSLDEVDAVTDLANAFKREKRASSLLILVTAGRILRAIRGL